MKRDLEFETWAFWSIPVAQTVTVLMNSLHWAFRFRGGGPGK